MQACARVHILQKYLESATESPTEKLENSDGKFNLRRKLRRTDARREFAHRRLYSDGFRRPPMAFLTE